MLPWPLAVFVMLPGCVLSQTRDVRIMHRVRPPSVDGQPALPPPWTERGIIDLDAHPTITPASLSALSAEWDAWYQIALGAASVPEHEWAMISLPVCRFLGSNLNDTISLHVDGGQPWYLEYQTSAAASACTMPPPAGSQVVLETSRTEIEIRELYTPTPVRLHPPEQIVYNDDGSIKKPERPKTFWEKWWPYLIPALIFMLLSPSADQPRDGQTGGPPAAGAPAGPARAGR